MDNFHHEMKLKMLNQIHHKQMIFLFLFAVICYSINCKSNKYNYRTDKSITKDSFINSILDTVKSDIVYFVKNKYIIDSTLYFYSVVEFAIDKTTYKLKSPNFETRLTHDQSDSLFVFSHKIMLQDLCKKEGMIPIVKANQYCKSIACDKFIIEIIDDNDQQSYKILISKSSFKLM